MNAVEIEEAVSELVEQPFEASEFPYAFLRAFGNKDTTLKRLRSGDTNKSDVGGVLQRNNIHLAVAPLGEVPATLARLRESPATAKHRAKFILATDGETVEAEELGSGDPLACAWRELPDHLGFFLPLAGITPVREIRENAFDIRATSKLNKLYVALLKENPEWGTAERRPDMNHFMARLIFSFFAEDTGIVESRLFTDTVSRMSAPDSSNTHEVIGAVFRAMDTKHAERERAELPRYALLFPYVNGGLFSGAMDVPRFSRTARSYLLQVGSLDWKQVNPDIFGSMIQAVADDEERGALGMHYTSVPNILKVLNPLFLDDLRAKLDAAGDNARTLLNLRKRIARIRIFDPACGSGNFLVIAYKEMRAIEQEINRRRGEAGRRSEIPLTNFRGIEIRDFAAEIARLALIIAEFQCDELYRGQKDAIQDFLPLDAENWITCGNALRLDWLSICPPTGTQVKLVGDDLFSTPLDQSEIDFENAGGEVYVCGNPPYKGGTEQTAEQKSDMQSVFASLTSTWRSLDYVSGWLVKFAKYAADASTRAGFVTTNSISQGEQVARLWPLILNSGHRILFAHTSFKWHNLAKHKAGVTVVIIGLGRDQSTRPRLFESAEGSAPQVREVENICPYLVPFRDIVIKAAGQQLSQVAKMTNGSKPVDGGHLILAAADAAALTAKYPSAKSLLRQLLGSADSIHGNRRFCLWIQDESMEAAAKIEEIAARLSQVRNLRTNSDKPLTRQTAATPHRFQQIRQVGNESVILVPRHSSESRSHLPIGLFPRGSIVADGAFALLDAPLWNFAILASSLHLVWVAAVCGKIKTDYRYSSTLGWNTFPVPILTEQNTADLTRCAEDILLTREAHFPATIAQMYDAETMPANLREAHERNDEVLERIYIGRRFRNDTERLEKLFAMYTQMTANEKRPAMAREKRA